MNTPDNSEVKVLRELVFRAISLQRQLDAAYQDDRYILDRLKKAIEIPSIQNFITDHRPRTSQHLGNCVENRLCDNPKSARSIEANWKIPQLTKQAKEELTEIYILGQEYGGEAWRPILGFAKKGRY